jgi:NAD(P)-dependent dehydrogenase (short-subunit alcohol dehydrogenase family)
MTRNAPSHHILITGASTGIGRACVLQLAHLGFSVWAGIRNPEEAKSIEQAGIDTSVPIRPIHLDVTDISSIQAAEKEIRSHTGDEGLFGLVNNAGICVVGPVEFISLQDWRQQLDVNFFGVIAVTQTMLPLLRLHHARCTSGGSRIANMGSITGEVSTPLFGAYSASKFALRAMNDALRLELRPEGIHVSLIVPGTIQSEIWRKEKESVDAIPSAAQPIYGNLIDNVARYVFSCADKAIPANRVADALQQCFTTPRPKVQYRVGWEAQVGSRAKKFIPDRLFDLLLARTMGVPKSTPPSNPSKSNDPNLQLEV